MDGREGVTPSAGSWMERRQAPISLGALLVGAVLGLAAPAAAPAFEAAITPVLMALLFATYLGVPFAELGGALRDPRFLGALTLVNFVAAPLVVLALSRIVAHEPALLVGVLLVLLAPCVDYVIAFARLGGGDATRLLAATPVLMLLQMALLPLLLPLMAGPAAVAAIDPAPFIHALLLFVAIPLALAILAQLVATRWSPARAAVRAVEAAMVPLMAATLVVVVASQIDAVRGSLALLLIVVPVFVVFAIVMPAIGDGVGRLLRQGAPARRSLAFSGATRNSLVVLPIALALPEPLALAALVVVTQTLVELVGLVVAVRVLPRLIR